VNLDGYFYNILGISRSSFLKFKILKKVSWNYVEKNSALF